VFQEQIMFGWAVSCLVIAIVAALYGFGGWNGPGTQLAKGVFVVGLVLFLALLVLGRRPPQR
jgi:uncharacterized membrane protein YtjA (UPF0391 family)